MVKEKVLPFKKHMRSLLPELLLEERQLTVLRPGTAGCFKATSATVAVVSDRDRTISLKGQTYLCTVVRSASKRASGMLSPKSSIGRVDLMVRGVVDECGLYDIIDGGQRREPGWRSRRSPLT